MKSGKFFYLTISKKILFFLNAFYADDEIQHFIAKHSTVKIPVGYPKDLLIHLVEQYTSSCRTVFFLVGLKRMFATLNGLRHAILT